MSATPKRKLFIGCSKETYDTGIANKVKTLINEHFKNSIDPIIWWHLSNWDSGKIAIQQLIEKIDEFYYGVFIAFPDDEIVKVDKHGKEDSYQTTRDNTILEYGMFVSKYGLDRTFLLYPNYSSKYGEFWLPSDIGSSLFHYDYTLTKDSTQKWQLEHFDQEDGLIKHIRDEETRISEIERNPEEELNKLVETVKQELNVNNTKVTKEFLVNKLRNKLDSIIYAKEAITGSQIKEIVTDVLDIAKDVRDFCKPKQLAQIQSYKNGIKSVWIFASNPIEFSAIKEKDNEDIELLRSAVKDNLMNGVKYTYFVSPDEFDIRNIDKVIERNSDFRKNITIVFAEPKLFKTFFTVHFRSDEFNAESIESVYMSSLLKHRNDLFIQITFPEHITRIMDRISILKGREDELHKVKLHNYTLVKHAKY
jgi:Predicted nucleotide-binding protein containing TIR-like domain